MIAEKKKYFILSCLLVLILLNTCNEESKISITVKKISDRVVVFNSLDVNVTAIISIDGIIIIDTNRSPGIIRKIKAEIENIYGRKDFIYVINTHGHWDHSSGNQVFEHVPIIGHINCQKYISNSKPNSEINLWKYENRILKMEREAALLNNNNNELEKINSDINGWKLILKDMMNEYTATPPSQTFYDSLALHLSDLTIKMIFPGNAHTNNDILIYIPEEKLIFTGDMFISESRFGFPLNKLVDIQKIITSMDKIITELKEIELIIPGHGNPFPGRVFNELKLTLIKKYNEIKDGESVVKLLQKWLDEDDINSALKKYSFLSSIETKSKFYWSEDEFNILGRRYISMGIPDKAIAVFKLETESFPNSALAYDNLGEAYFNIGDIGSAVENYRKSLAIFPDNRNAEEILEFLDENKK